MLTNLKITTKVVKVPHEKYPSFVLELAYVSREDLTEIRKVNTSIKFNSVTRQREEVVDSEAFLAEYVKRAIKGWSGLTIGIVKKLVPIETLELDGKEVPFSYKDALWLVRNSSDFDTYFSDLMNQIDVFTKEDKDNSKKA